MKKKMKLHRAEPRTIRLGRTGARVKPVIGFDLDGVIIDHSKNKEIILKHLGLAIKKKELATDILGTKVPMETWRTIQEFLYGHPKHSQKPRPFEGIEYIFKELKRRNVEYVLISRRRNEKTAMALLKKRKLWPRFLNRKNTFFVRHISGKHEKAKELGISHYIDDQPSVLKELKSVKNRFLFDPHGSHGHTRHYKKISSWKEFMKEIDDMIEK